MEFPQFNAIFIMWAVAVLAVFLGAADQAWASPEPTPGPRPAAPFSGVLLSPEELGSILGVELTVAQWSLSSPNGPNQTMPEECRLAGNATTTLVFGIDWVEYQGSSFADGEGTDYQTVGSQVAGVFATPKAAAAVFATLTKGLRACGGKTSVEHRAGKDMTWHNSTDKITPSSATWHSVLDDRPRWRCALQAQLKSRTVLEASVCRFVDPASSAEAAGLADQVATITGKIAARTS